MYKKDNIIIIVISIFLIMLSFKITIFLNQDIISDFITFISIYLGFIITSFTIMTSNNEIKKLYTVKDGQNYSITCLHRLANYYTTNFLLSLFTLMLLLVTEMFKIEFFTSKVILSLIFSILYSSLTLLKILLDIFTNKIILTK